MSIQTRSFSNLLHSPQIGIKETALKEWAVCIEALAKGDQLVLLRKGGILEETREFRLEETSFYLYPTYEHQKPHLIKSRFHPQYEQTLEGVEIPPKEVVISCLAHVSDDIQITETEQLKRLSSFHVLTEQYAADRLRWKPKQPLHVLVVRAYRLEKPKTIQVHEAYLGCRSWLALKEEFGGAASIPVLTDEQFSTKRNDLFQALGIRPEQQ